MNYETIVCLVAAIMLGLCAIINFIILVCFWYQSSSYLKTQDEKKSFIRLRNIGLINMISVILMLLFYGSYAVSGIYTTTQVAFNITYLFYGIATCLRVITATTFMFFQIWRIYQTFEHTIYQVKSKIILIHTILTIGIAITFLIAWILAFPIFSTNTSLEYYFILCIPLWLSVSIIQIHIAYLFSNKLFAITLSIRQSEMNDIILSQRQDRLLNTIAKQTLLVAVETILFVMCVLLWLLWVVAIYWIGNWEVFVIVVIIDVTTFFAYLIVIPLTMWFSFAFAQTQYNYCCNRLHLLCVNWYRNSAISKLSHEMNNTYDNKYVQMEAQHSAL